MHFRKIWLRYFFVKLFFLFFAFGVFARLTSLGDTSSYLNGPLTLGPQILYSSTAMMVFLGGLFKKIFLVDVLASIPFMILSFYGVYYAVDRLNLYRYPKLVLLILCMPNFLIWTSVLSKEAVGCFFSGILVVLVVRHIKGDCRFRWIDYVALYLCFLFKPQYLLFIGQAILFLKVAKWAALTSAYTMLLGCLIIFLNLGLLYVFREQIDTLAQGMYIHFTYSDPDMALSTRNPDPWLVKYGFFKEAPYGMFISFFGPTFHEMLSKPTHMISGLESVFLLFLYAYMIAFRIIKVYKKRAFDPKIFISYIIIFLGILFVHYPFGYLNPGSAIRYRENFYLLFSILLLCLHGYIPFTISNMQKNV